MKVEKIESSRERKLVTLMIMDDDVCRNLSVILNPKELKAPYSFHVATWALAYYEEYKTAPKASIQDIWESKRKAINDDEMSASIAEFLRNLFEEYDPTDYEDKQYHIEDCEAYVREIHLEAFSKMIQQKIDAGKYEEAESQVSNFQRTGTSVTEGVSLIENIEVYERAFSDENLEPLFRFRGHLGKITPPLYRGDFFAVLSTAKAGKSFAIQHTSECALKDGCTVLSINLEMRETEFLQRYWRCVHMAPLVSGYFDIPIFEPDVEPGTDPETATSWRFNHKNVYRDAVSFANKDEIRENMAMRYRGGDIVQLTLPAYSTTIEDIEAILDNMEYFNHKKFDVVCIDYADLLGSKEREYRHKLNDIWLNLRRVAQERNVCMVTVSQSNAEGLDGKEINLSSVAEDKRKIAHVTSLVGMWGTDEDRRRGIVRMKNLVSRYKTDEYGTVIVAQNLDLGQFHLDSKLEANVVGL